MKPKITPIAFAIHLPTESPIIGENTIHVRIEDEGAGPFFTIAMVDGEAGDPISVSYDFSVEINQVAALLLEAVPELEDKTP